MNLGDPIAIMLDATCESNSKKHSVQPYKKAKLGHIPSLCKKKDKDPKDVIGDSLVKALIEVVEKNWTM